jgi:hypothetical protein
VPSGAARSAANAVHAANSWFIAQPGSPVDSNGNPVNEPRAALIFAGAGYQGSQLAFVADTRQGTDPATDPNWRNPGTSLEWDLFSSPTPGQNQAPIASVVFANPNGTPSGALFLWDSHGKPVLSPCAVSVRYNVASNNVAGVYVAAFDASCIANPTKVYWGALIFYDTNPADTAGTQAIVDSAPEQAPLPAVDPYDDLQGYWLFGRDGAVYPHGGHSGVPIGSYGSLAGLRLNQPIVGGAATPSKHGYWLVATDGGVFSFGDAQFYGSTGSIRLNQPIVGIIPTPSGHGYWLVASDGGVFSYGDASFHGSTGSIRLNQPIVGGWSTATGNGYYLVASDGGIFAFGTGTPFLGSTGSIRLNQPVVGGAESASGQGYYLVASDGGIFAFGSGTPFLGSTGSLRLNSPIVGMAVGPHGGYRFVAADGGIFSFGLPFEGSEGGMPLSAPIVGMASAD